MQEPEAGRRIVSRGAYAASVSRKTALWCVGAALNLTAVIASGVVVITISERFPTMAPAAKWALMLLMFVACFAVRAIGGRSVRAAKKVQTGVPLTRANTADLPAPDSLVRASQEPAQAQEGVLLRAASVEAQAGQEGQLLRASVGGQE